MRPATRSRKPRGCGVCVGVGDPGLEPGTSSLSVFSRAQHGCESASGSSWNRQIAGKALGARPVR
jgi:hypothetical protein